MCERDSCRFLERRPGVQSLTCCAVGVNFCSVGQARELCRLCPLFDEDWTPTCEFLEVYTYLRVEKRQQRIEVRFDCWLPEGEVTQSRCAACPAASTLVPRGNEAPEAWSPRPIVRDTLRDGL